MSKYICEKCNIGFNLKKDYTKHINQKFSCESKNYNESPLRYPGGKTRACKILDEILCKNFPDLTDITLVSPFFGGGSFEFYFQNKYGSKVIANDKFKPLISFWNQCKLNKNILVEELRKITNVNKDTFNVFRSTIMNLNDNELQQAIQYFVINRCSFSGATLSGGFSEEASKKRFTPSSIEKVENLNLENFEFHNLDFSIFLNLEFSNKRLIFLDPPYYLENNSKLYGEKGDLHENFDHTLLYQIISEKNNWILTYNDCEYIRELYKDFTILEVDWKYGMNKSKESSEIVIINF